MGKSRLLAKSISANQIHEFGSFQSLWDSHIIKGRNDLLVLFFCQTANNYNNSYWTGWLYEKFPVITYYYYNMTYLYLLLEHLYFV